MIENIKKVAKFEYTRTIKKKSFWFGVLFMPIFIIAITAISTLSSVEAQNKADNLVTRAKKIYIQDETGILLDSSTAVNEIKLNTKRDLSIETATPTGLSTEDAIKEVKDQKVEVFIEIPFEFLATASYKVYAKDPGLFADSAYSTFVDSLIKQSAVNKLTEPLAKLTLVPKFNAIQIFYDDKGNVVENITGKIILAILSVMLFFLSVFISSQFLLQSVSEEKENRMIEVILSIINSRTLIWGKIVGLSGVVLTQLGVWIISGTLIFLAAKNTLNVDLSMIPLSSFGVGNIFINILFIFLAFFLFAGIMVGVGAIGQSYKDSQNLSSIFIISAVFPMYFINLIISDPSGTLSKILTYFPFSSSLMVIIRNSFNAISLIEILLALVVNILFVSLAFFLAVKLFDLGNLDV